MLYYYYINNIILSIQYYKYQYCCYFLVPIPVSLHHCCTSRGDRSLGSPLVQDRLVWHRWHLSHRPHVADTHRTLADLRTDEVRLSERVRKSERFKEGFVAFCSHDC